MYTHDHIDPLYMVWMSTTHLHSNKLSFHYFGVGGWGLAGVIRGRQLRGGSWVAMVTWLSIVLITCSCCYGSRLLVCLEVTAMWCSLVTMVTHRCCSIPCKHLE